MNRKILDTIQQVALTLLTVFGSALLLLSAISILSMFDEMIKIFLKGGTILSVAFGIVFVSFIGIISIVMLFGSVYCFIMGLKEIWRKC